MSTSQQDRASQHPAHLFRRLFKLFSPFDPKKKDEPDIAPKVYKRLPTPSPNRIQQSLEEIVYQRGDVQTPGRTVFYLAYGSNLSYESFQGMRGIRPIAALNVVVPELKLTFDLAGLAYSEPCFANSALREDDSKPDPDTAATPLLPAKSSTDSRPLMGVVYEISVQDYAHVLATESTIYGSVLIDCSALDSPLAVNHESGLPFPAISPGTKLRAHTLLVPPRVTRIRDPPAQPSVRYLNLLRKGAEEHAMPAEWKDYLNAMEGFEITTTRQKVGKVVFMLSFGPPFIFFMGLGHLMARSGHQSSFLANAMQFFGKAAWLTYDWIYKPIFGDGERTIKNA